MCLFDHHTVGHMAMVSEMFRLGENGTISKILFYFYFFDLLVDFSSFQIYGDNYKFEKKKSQPKDRKNKNKKGSLISSHSPPIETFPIPLPYDQQYDGQINTSNPNPNPNSNLNF